MCAAPLEAVVRQKESVVDTSSNGMDRSRDGKEKSLSLAVAQIERQFGKGSIMRLGAQPSAWDIAVIRPARLPRCGPGGGRDSTGL